MVPPFFVLFASVAHNRLLLHLRAIDHALAVRPDAFAAAGGAGIGIGIGVGDKGGDDAVLHAADADAALPARMVTILAGRDAGFRVGGIEDVVLVDDDAAGPSELGEDRQHLSVLI